MSDSRVALSIHSNSFARHVVKLLKEHGINVQTDQCDIPGLRNEGFVRIIVDVNDVRSALSILENFGSYTRTLEDLSTGKGRNVLIPVDFSHFSLAAVDVGFQFAEILKMRPLLLHAYPDPEFNDETRSRFYTKFAGRVQSSVQSEDLRDLAADAMKSFRLKIEEEIESGFLPNLRFSSAVTEGIPEEVILDSTRISPPSLIVMATRGVHKKATDLIGSVTAEVMDSCRTPIFTVPENFSLKNIRNVRHVVFLCSLSGRDVMAMSVFNQFFPEYKSKITLIPVADKGDTTERTLSLCSHLCHSFPNVDFKYKIFSSDRFRYEFEEYYKESGIDMIIVPNRKRNIFSRLINPGIAHRIIFEKDVPMLVIPV